MVAHELYQRYLSSPGRVLHHFVNDTRDSGEKRCKVVTSDLREWLWTPNVTQPVLFIDSRLPYSVQAARYRSGHHFITYMCDRQACNEPMFLHSSHLCSMVFRN